jgi:peptidyl-prolyl cis-trans isomerase D
MPSNDSNTPTTKESKVTKFKQKGKEKISFGRIITYVILALIAIALIFSVVLPSFSRQGQASSITFGTLDGKPIEFRYGNYFYRQYQNLAQQNKGSSDAVAYQIWRGAFENTVIYTALNKMAVDVGYKVTDEKLNQAIIDSGAYNRDGKFDTKLYEQTPADRKKTVKQQIEENLPLEAVMNDISSLLTASGELDYIMSIGDKSRSFEYALFDYSLYPDALATNYGQNNVALFSLIDIDVVNAATLEEANALLDNKSEGQRDLLYYYELQQQFKHPEEVNILFSTKVGGYSPIFETLNGYAFFKVNKQPFGADFKDQDVINDIKQYIGSHDSEIIISYVADKVDTFVDRANQVGFDEAVKELALKSYTIEPTSANVAASNYLSGFNYTDEMGYLRLLSGNREIMRSLFTSEVGSILGPYESNGATLVVTPTAEVKMDDEMRSYIEIVHPYYAKGQSQQDLLQQVFYSDRLTDNFLQAFFENFIAGRENN